MANNLLKQLEQALYADGPLIVGEKYADKLHDLVNDKNLYMVAAGLEAIDALNNGSSLEEASQLLDKYEDAKRNIVPYVAELCDRGQEFADYIQIGKQHQKEAIFADLREKGAAIIGEQYIDEWNMMLDGVTDRAYEYLHCSDKYDCLEIVAALNAGYDFEAVSEILEAQNHSANVGLHIADDAASLCDRGKDFADYAREQEFGDIGREI